MAGPNPLAALFSWANGVKRRVSNPLETIGLGMIRGAEDLKEMGRNDDIAYGLNGMKSVLITPEQKAQAAKASADFGANMALAGATVWHGSPHKFDKFDASKIGTGEGAQAYGHGLYLAESPDVAKSYQKTLTAENGFLLDGKKMTRAQVQDALNAERSGYLDGVTRPSGVADYHMDALSNASFGKPKRFADGTERGSYWESLQSRLSKEDHGSLYKVDLPDNAIAKMLDWDKPLSEQAPAVQEALNRAGLYDGAARNVSGNVLQDITEYISKRDGRITTKLKKDQAAAAEAMRQAGIPGIRYLDGGSRGAGGGTSNYVVFPGQEDILKILERNGVKP